MRFEEPRRDDWRGIVSTPPAISPEGGNQILHFNSKNRHFSKDPAAAAFVAKHLLHAEALDSDTAVLDYASKSVTLKKGAYIEMGVCTGRTANFIAALNPDKTIHGFDSFEGLPEDWVRDDKVMRKGTFALNAGMLPPVLPNVKLHAGLFNETLPHFLQEELRSGTIGFLHIDCDLYSSTKETFDILGKNIEDGTIIVFDELYNYPGYKNHEYKALQEFLQSRNLAAEYIAYNANHQQVVVRIKKAKAG